MFPDAVPHREALLQASGSLQVAGVPEGADGLLLGSLAQNSAHFLAHVARDEVRMFALLEQIGFFAPEVEVLCFPAWDCLPYDRVSPRMDVMMQRMETLFRLQEESGSKPSKPRILLTTVNAILQRVVPRETIESAGRRIRSGAPLNMEDMVRFCERSGYMRVDVVAEPGEFARRGGLLDIYPAAAKEPLRLDFFGDILESLRGFDAASQLTSVEEEEILLLPASEVFLDISRVSHFRSGYVARFGPASGEDPLYQSISQGRRFRGMEHWLPLFYGELETLFHYLPGNAWLSFDNLAEGGRQRRLESVAEYYEERVRYQGKSSFGTPVYQPLESEELYIQTPEWDELLSAVRVRRFTPGISSTEEASGIKVDATIDLGVRCGRDFLPERKQAGSNVFDVLVRHIDSLREKGVRVFAASWSAPSRDRLCALLQDHGVSSIARPDTWKDALDLPGSTLASISLGLEAGVESRSFAIISEQDILGERLIRRRPKRRQIFFDVGDLVQGDFVVHVDHGIARFDGLHTLEAAGALHDCLLLVYRDGDRLFLPVENADLISRYSSAEGEVVLDRLGGGGWQARKAGLKKRLRNLAGRLIATAKARAMSSGAVMDAPPGYEEFCARFPFEETEDQAQTMDLVARDLMAGRPMDRLVCGDVGFGKTEVALRAAFISVMNGWQVAVLAPTTLLSRQHFATFRERFFGFPVEIRQLSRFVSTAEARECIADLASGKVDIVVGTHALLAKRVKFHALGLFVLDEEQHFGVRHKERLKELQHGVHVLTLTATPIPRTLQLALSGVRELSVIATPPVDRIAVRSFLLPFDPVVVRETLLRERYRGGRSFYVCPRIADLEEVVRFLREYVPELKVVTAHGRMAVSQLDASMTAFYEGGCDVLLSTNIVESGLDIPEANTLIVHRSELFGLAQLYQLRGRIGRSKVRAYAYFTVPANRVLPESVERRLQVLLSMEELGSGFRLAFHDLDIRGSGNLLGEEQSGHIREVGFELYRAMLEEALQESRGEVVEETWSPRIGLGVSALIPESYINDVSLRMGLYRRLGRFREIEDVNSLEEEMVDRFGSLPESVEYLLGVVRVKIMCRRAGVERMDIGEGGVMVKFRGDWFADPAGLAHWMESCEGQAWLRPDHHLIWKGCWKEGERIGVCLNLAGLLADLAGASSSGAV